MQKIVLDFSECKCWDELHEVIKNVLDFPDYYGKNLGALWDCAQEYAYSEVPVTIEIIGTRKYSSISEEHDESINGILKVLNRINDRIKDAQVIVLS